MSLLQYQLGQQVMFDAGWPVPARRRWVTGRVVELIDALLGDDYDVRHRVVVVREVMGGHVARSGAYRFEPQDAAGIRPADPAPRVVVADQGTRAFVLERIAAMGTRPLMWAASREAFGLQLVLLVEIVRGGDATAETMQAVFGPGPTLGEGYDDAWAREAAAAARALIEGPEDSRIRNQNDNNDARRGCR